MDTEPEGLGSAEADKVAGPVQTNEARGPAEMLDASNATSVPIEPETHAESKKKDKKNAKKGKEPASEAAPAVQTTVVVMLHAEAPPAALDTWGNLSHAGIQRASFLPKLFSPKLERRGSSWFSRTTSDLSPLLGASASPKTMFSPSSPFRFLDSFLSPKLKPERPIPQPQTAGFLPITHIFAPRPTLILGSDVAASKGWAKKTNSRGFAHLRPRQTVEPLAKTLGLKVDDRFGVDEWREVVEAIREIQDGTVLVCWERTGAEKIAGALASEDGIRQAMVAGLIVDEKREKREKKRAAKEAERRLKGEDSDDEAMFEMEENELSEPALGELLSEPELVPLRDESEPAPSEPVVAAEELASDLEPVQAQTETPTKKKDREKKKKRKEAESSSVEPASPSSSAADVTVPTASGDFAPSETSSAKKDEDKKKKDKGKEKEKEKPIRIPFPSSDFESHDTYLVLKNGAVEVRRMNYTPQSTPIFAPEDLDTASLDLEGGVYLGPAEGWDEGDGGLGTGCCWLGGQGCGPGWECRIL